MRSARASQPRVARLVLLVCILCACAAGSAIAQIRYPSLPAMEAVPDARSLGLGRAYTAIGEGPSGAWWNPGSLGLPRAWEGTYYTDVGRRSFLGGDVSVYAVSGPVRDIGIVLHVIRVGEGDYGFGQRKSDLLVTTGVGVDLVKQLCLADPNRMHWGVGGSLKLYRTGFEDDREPGRRYRNHATEFDADVGSLLSIRVPLRDRAESGLFPPAGSPATPYLGLRVGAVVRNALGHEIDLWEGSGGEIPFGTNARGGVALEIGSASPAPLGPWVAGTFSAELAGATEVRTDNPMRNVGFELRLLDFFSLRYGEIRDYTIEWKAITRGVGIQVGLPGRGGMRLDWAQVPFPCCSETTEQVTAGFWVTQ